MTTPGEGRARAPGPADLGPGDAVVLADGDDPAAPSTTSEVAPDGDGGTRRAHRRSTTVLVLIALVALGLRLAYVGAVASHHDIEWDATYYHTAANAIAQGHGYAITCPILDQCTYRPAAFFGPGFSAVLAVASVLGFDSVGAHRVVAALLGALGVFLIGLLARRVAGVRASYVTAVLAAAYLHWIVLEGALMSEALAVPLTVLVLLLGYRALDRPTARRWGLVGFVVGLAALTRGEGVLWLALLVLPGTLGPRSLPWSRRLLCLGAATAACLVVLVPWGIRNTAVAGSFSVLQGNGGVVGGANCDATYTGSDLGGWSCDQTIDVGGERVGVGSSATTEQEWGRIQSERGVAYARAHAGRLPVVVVARELRAFSVLRPTAYEAGERRARPLVAAEIWFVLPVGLAGLVVLRRRRRRVWPLVAPIVLVVVAVALSWGNQRLRVTAEPSLLVGCGVVGAAAWDRLRARSSALTAAPGAEPPAGTPVAATPAGAPLEP